MSSPETTGQCLPAAGFQYRLVLKRIQHSADFAVLLVQG